MLTFPVPKPVRGDLLAEHLAAAGLTSDLYVSNDRLILPDLDEADRAAVQAVVDAHPAKAQAALDAAAAERTNETTIRDRAAQALAANTTFLNIATPSNAQVVAQVKALTRQNTALIRLVLNRFDGTD